MTLKNSVRPSFAVVELECLINAAPILPVLQMGTAAGASSRLKLAFMVPERRMRGSMQGA